MKQIRKFRTVFLMLGVLVLFSFPNLVLGEETGMQNEVGIGFENDYEPSSSTDEPDLPSGTTEPSKIPNKSNATGKKTSFPATGEKKTMLPMFSGVFLIAAVGVILWQRREGKVNK